MSASSASVDATVSQKQAKISKKTIFFTALILVIFAGIFGYKIFVNIMIAKFLAHFTFPPSTVSVIKAETQDWAPFLTATGNVVAIEGVNITPQVSGVVTKILFKSGQQVKQGDLLISLDDKEQLGDLASAKAATALAEINYKRDLKLLASGSVSQSSVDTDLATLEEKKGAQTQAEAQLNYRHIQAPFSGTLGIRMINLGQFLNAGDVITNIQTVDPIYVDYYLPEQDISQIHVGQSVQVFVTAFPKKTFTGVIEAIDAKVSQDTHSILIRSEVKNNNPNARLTPGMFTTVHTLLPVLHSVTTLPLQAVNYTLYGESVYAIEPLPAPVNISENTAGIKEKNNKNNKNQSEAKHGSAMGMTGPSPTNVVKLIYVKTGLQMGDRVQVLEGIKPGQTVVLQGQVKLQDGAAVIVENTESLDQAIRDAQNNAKKMDK